MNEEARRGEVAVPWLDEWEKGWNEKLKAETLKPEMPKVVAVDFRMPQIVPVVRDGESALVSVAQSN